MRSHFLDMTKVLPVTRNIIHSFSLFECHKVTFPVTRHSEKHLFLSLMTAVINIHLYNNTFL